jgi:uncharacterized protein YcbX
MHLAEIWRYPVKSMAGEQLEEVELGRDGVPGDRLVQVRQIQDRTTGAERIVTARSWPLLLRHHATLGADGEPLVDGLPWRHVRVRRNVELAAGEGAWLELSPAVEHRYDILPLLVATDGAIDSLRLDRRRFRPNLLIAGVEGLAEKGWEGRRLKIGEVVIALADLRGRCVMTTFDPDNGAQDPRVLRTIVERLGGVLGLNAEVARPGRVRVGDPVELL